MCDTCGCGDSEILPVHVHESLLKNDDHQAEHNREHFQESGVLALNIMGSPGSGKTTLLEATARQLGGQRLRAMSGDLATDNAARAFARRHSVAYHYNGDGVPSRCAPGPPCPARSSMELEYLFIENVGNLVCPPLRFGTNANVVVLSVTEGEDKPLKYPVIFQRADLVLFTKVGLLPICPGSNWKTTWRRSLA